MNCAKPFLEKNIHPTVIVSAFFKALNEASEILEELAIPVDTEDVNDVKKALYSCVGTKFAKRWGDLIVDLAL